MLNTVEIRILDIWMPVYNMFGFQMVFNNWTVKPKSPEIGPVFRCYHIPDQKACKAFNFESGIHVPFENRNSQQLDSVHLLNNSQIQYPNISLLNTNFRIISSPHQVEQYEIFYSLLHWWKFNVIKKNVRYLQPSQTYPLT